MSDVTIVAAQITGFAPPLNLTEVEARVYVNAPFLPLGADAPVTSGTVNTSNWYRRFTCPTSNNVLFLPEIILPATRDAAPNTSKYSIYFYQPNQTRPEQGLIEAYTAFLNFALPATPSTTSWAEIFSFNAAAGTIAAAQLKGYWKNIESNITATGNVTTGLDVLHSKSLDAASLANDLDALRGVYGGFFASNDNDKRLQIELDGQTIANTGLWDFDGGDWSIAFEIIRISATTVQATVRLVLGQATAVGAATAIGAGNGAILGARNATLSGATAVANLNSNAVVLRLLAEGTATNDIVQNLSLIDLLQR